MPLPKLLKAHDYCLRQMTHKAGLTTDVHDPQEQMRNMEAQVAKIAESEPLILVKFRGKPEPNPI